MLTIRSIALLGREDRCLADRPAKAKVVAVAGFWPRLAA